MTTWVNNFEGGTAGADFTTAASGGVGNQSIDAFAVSGTGSITFDNSWSHSGSLSLAMATSASTQTYIRWKNSTFGSLSNFYFRLYFTIPAIPDKIISVFNTLGGTIGNYGMAILTSGKVAHRELSTSTNYGTTATTLPINTPIRLEGHLTTSTAANAEVAQGRLFFGANVDGTVPDESWNSTGFTGASANIDTFQYGIIGAASTLSLNLDDIGLSNTGWIGPSVVSSAPNSEGWGFLPL